MRQRNAKCVVCGEIFCYSASRRCVRPAWCSEDCRLEKQRQDDRRKYWASPKLRAQRKKAANRYRKRRRAIDPEFKKREAERSKAWRRRDKLPIVPEGMERE